MSDDTLSAGPYADGPHRVTFERTADGWSLACECSWETTCALGELTDALEAAAWHVAEEWERQ